jgi:glycosyltransferase involved in cell wall biosynthesis
MGDINFGIVISTYKRQDGSTPKVLKRALDSIFNQTYQKFKIFLVGDKYEDENEILEILKNYSSDKISFVNLTEAKERDNYTEKRAIWSYGGVNAINYGIDVSLKDGYEYICHLDHDDWWASNHLEEFYKCLTTKKYNWLCTKSTYRNPKVFLPKVDTDSEYINFQPRSSALIHSSVCMNFKEINLKYRDLYLETGKVGLPADADLWERTREFLEKKGETGVLINKLTCFHEEEGFSLR